MNKIESMKQTLKHNLKQKEVKKVSVGDIKIGETKTIYRLASFKYKIEVWSYFRKTEKTILAKEVNTNGGPEKIVMGYRPFETFFPTKIDAENELFNLKLDSLNNAIEEALKIPEKMKKLEEMNNGIKD